MSDTVEKKSKWGKVGTIFIATLSIVLCATGIAYVRTDIPAAASKYQENLTMAKGAGAVFSREDALAVRQVPKSENAVYALQDFIKKIDPLRVDFERNVTSDNDFLDEWKSVANYLPALLTASNKKFFMVENALRYPDDYPSSHPYMLVKWAKALCWLADISAKKSDIKTSAELLLAAARLSIMVDHDPDFEAKEARGEMAEAVDRELSLLITSHGDEPSWQAVIEQVMTILESPYDFRPCYKYSHWLTLHNVQLELGEIRDPKFADRMLGERFIPRYNKATMSRVHELYGKMLQQYPTDIADYAQIDAINKELFGRYDNSSMSFQTFYSSLDRYGSYIWEARVEVAARNAIIQALAIKKQRLDPSRGLPIKGRHSEDFDGKPIRIKKLPNGWVVYSIGRDGKDNGGDESKRYPRDWVVHLTK